MQKIDWIKKYLFVKYTQCKEGNNSSLLLLFRRVRIGRRIERFAITGNRLDCLSFIIIGIVAGEEKLYLRTAGDQVEVRYCKIMFTNHINPSSKVISVQFEVI